jgi:hypothetical protein
MKKNIVLWIAQGLLACAFLFAGGAKLVMSAEQMASPGPVQLPVFFIRFIGVCETLGAIGMILPGLLSIRPGLTLLAAGGLVIIMIGASVINVMNGMAALAIPTVILGLMAAFVAAGRWRANEKRKTENGKRQKRRWESRPSHHGQGARRRHCPLRTKESTCVPQNRWKHVPSHRQVRATALLPRSD